MCCQVEPYRTAMHGDSPIVFVVGKPQDCSLAGGRMKPILLASGFKIRIDSMLQNSTSRQKKGRDR